MVDLDYKFLTDGEHDPLEVLQPVLTASNINPLAKVAAKLPNKVSKPIGTLHQYITVIVF